MLSNLETKPLFNKNNQNKPTKHSCNHTPPKAHLVKSGNQVCAFKNWICSGGIDRPSGTGTPVEPAYKLITMAISKMASTMLIAQVLTFECKFICTELSSLCRR